MTEEKPIFPSSFMLGQDQETRAKGETNPAEYAIVATRKINILEGDTSQRMSTSQGFINRFIYRTDNNGGFAMLETMPTAINYQMQIDILDRKVRMTLPLITQGFVPDNNKQHVTPWSFKDTNLQGTAWWSILAVLDEVVDQMSSIWDVTYTLPIAGGEKIECNIDEYRRLMTYLKGRISEYFDHRLKFDKMDYKLMVLDHGGKTMTYGPNIEWQTGHNNSKVLLTADFPSVPDRYKMQQRAAELEFKIGQFVCWLLNEVKDQTDTQRYLLEGITRDRLSIITTELRLSTPEMIESLAYRLLHQMDLLLNERLYSKLRIFTMCIQELFRVYSDVVDPMFEMSFSVDCKIHDLPLLRDKEFVDSFFNARFKHPHAGTKKVFFLPIGDRNTPISPVFSFLKLDYSQSTYPLAIMVQDYTDVAPEIGAPTQAFGSELCIPRDRNLDTFYPVNGAFTGLEAIATRQGLLDQQDSKQTLIIDRDHPYPLYPITLDGFTAAIVASNTSILDGAGQYPIRIWNKNRNSDEWY